MRKASRYSVDIRFQAQKPKAKTNNVPYFQALEGNNGVS
jgi:hypothetical protein